MLSQTYQEKTQYLTPVLDNGAKNLIHLASTSFFSPITWLDICKYEMKNLEQAKTSVIGEIRA